MARSISRDELLVMIGDLIPISAPFAPVFRVAVDGIDCAGKTTFADALGTYLEQSGSDVVRASVDGFHHPASVRLAHSTKSPAETYYNNSFDYDAMCRVLLDPLNPEGSRFVRTAVFDHRKDESVVLPEVRVEAGGVVIVDGVFMIRPELRDYWDLSVYLDVDPLVALERAVQRDAAFFGSRQIVTERYRSRYLPGQRMYLANERPDVTADVVIGYNDFEQPVLKRFPQVQESDQV